MLQSTYSKCPEIYPFVKQCYSQPTILSFGEYELLSQRGCQQGDPCGPPLFCVGIEDMTNSIASVVNLWYLDDGTLGGEPQVVHDDVKTVIEEAAKIGLALNPKKCEILIIGEATDEEKVTIVNAFNETLPGISQY